MCIEIVDRKFENTAIKKSTSNSDSSLMYSWVSEIEHRIVRMAHIYMWPYISSVTMLE